MLTAGIRQWNGYVPNAPRITRLNVKWDHIFQYKRVGIFSVIDGCTVAEYLDDIT